MVFILKVFVFFIPCDMFEEKEFEFKKPQEEILPGEEPEQTAPPPLSRLSLAGIISTIAAILNLCVFIPRVFYMNYFSFATSTPESFGAVIFIITGLTSGIIAIVKPTGKPFFRYFGFWGNLLAVFLYLILAFYHLFFNELN